MNKLVLSIVVLGSYSLAAMEITTKEGLSAPSHLKIEKIFKGEDGFEVVSDGEYVKVHDYDVDPVLHKLNPDNIDNFKKYGRIDITQLSNGEYKLKAKANIKGGGPLTGMILAWSVRALMYTGGAVAAGAAEAASVGAGPLAPAVAAQTTAQIIAATPAYIATVEGASTAAGILGYAILWLP